MIRFDSILYVRDSIMAVNVSWLGVSWGLVSQMYQFKTELPSTKPTLKFA